VSLEIKSFSSRVKQPGVVVRALEAGVKAESLSRQLSVVNVIKLFSQSEKIG
jgi:hypothetical protein